jgi:undecaprenyl-diphosphatase
VLGSHVLGWPDQGLVFDVAAHAGTLLAVLFYFRRDLIGMARALFVSTPVDEQRRQRTLAVCLAVASVPALIVGALASGLVEHYLRDVRVIAWATLVFGLLLWLADALGPRRKEIEDVALASMLWIGMAQVLALVPGVSRSGVTITAARVLGFQAEAAARISFLLAIPIIAAAGAYGALRVATGEAPFQWGVFLLAMGVAAIAGWACIAAFLALLRRVGLLPFVLYRLALGLALLWLLY